MISASTCKWPFYASYWPGISTSLGFKRFWVLVCNWCLRKWKMKMQDYFAFPLPFPWFFFDSSLACTRAAAAAFASSLFFFSSSLLAAMLSLCFFSSLNQKKHSSCSKTRMIWAHDKITGNSAHQFKIQNSLQSSLFIRHTTKTCTFPGTTCYQLHLKNKCCTASIITLRRFNIYPSQNNNKKN